MSIDISMVKSAVKLTAHQTLFTLKRYSPEILTVLGVGGLIASGVNACIATTKIEQATQKANDDIQKAHEYHNINELPDGSEYADKDFNRDVAIYTGRKALALVKLYAPSVGLAMVSTLCIFKAHKILTERNAALAAAYTTVSKSYKAYRERVKNCVGEEVEKEIRYNIAKTKIEETQTDENGKEKKKKVDAEVAGMDGVSEYARYFVYRDKNNPMGTEEEVARFDLEHQLNFLSCKQKVAEQMLISRGYLFLNEMYDLCGFPQTQAGQIVGRRYDPKHGLTDHTVDFGLHSYYVCKAAREDGVKKAMLLDFQVDDEPIIYALKK